MSRLLVLPTVNEARKIESSVSDHVYHILLFWNILCVRPGVNKGNNTDFDILDVCGPKTFLRISFVELHGDFDPSTVATYLRVRRCKPASSDLTFRSEQTFKRQHWASAYFNRYSSDQHRQDTSVSPEKHYFTNPNHKCTENKCTQHNPRTHAWKVRVELLYPEKENLFLLLTYLYFYVCSCVIVPRNKQKTKKDV